MIRILMLVCALAGLAGAQSPIPALSGRTLDEKGQPLRKVMLTLLPLAKNAAGDPLEPFGVNSNNAGQFEFYGVPPGRYRLMAERAGYPKTFAGARNSWAPGSTLTVRAGQTLSGLNVRMIAQASVSGQVLADDAASYTSVYLLQQRYQDGRKQLTRVISASGEPGGAFSINKIAPGRYYLAAEVRASGPAASGQQPETFVLTYYPGVTDIASAEAIDFRSGQTVVDVRWRVRKGRPVAISGSILRKPADVARAAVILSSAASQGMFGMMVLGDTFRISGVPPGDYSVRAVDYSGAATRVLAQRSLQVSSEDMEGVNLDLDPSAGPRGTVRVQDGLPPGAKLRVQLTPVNDSRSPSMADVKPDGTFAMAGSLVGQYRLEILGLPPDAYVKSAVFGEKNALGVLDLASPAGEEKFAIVIGPGAAHISGVVFDEKRKPLDAVVTLIPDPPQPQRASLYQLVDTDENGRFLFQGLRPGKYRLYAWEEFENGAQFDPEVTAPLQARSVAIEVAEGDRKEVSVTRISVDDAAAARNP